MSRPAHDQKQLVFVYGSLKRGYALHHLLESQPCLGNAVTRPLYRLFDLGAYPGIVEWPEGLAIRGEVYEADEDCLVALDKAEGVSDGFYARRAIQLQPPFDQLNVDAWFWLHPVPGLTDCGHEWPPV